MLTKQKKLTYDDYYRLDDEKRYEVIEGELIEMPAPSLPHQEILQELFIKLNHYVKKYKLGKIYIAPCDVIFSESYVLQPDIIFILKENHITQERGIFGSPDLVVEILSPSTSKKDQEDKFRIYEKFGVKEYWIVDPDGKTAEVFTLKNDQYHSFCITKKKINSKLFADIEIDVREVFTSNLNEQEEI